jgi:hypothetical protein
MALFNLHLAMAARFALGSDSDTRVGAKRRSAAGLSLFHLAEEDPLSPAFAARTGPILPFPAGYLSKSSGISIGAVISRPQGEPAF